ncbi:MAG: GNAT family N-acetyltransferase [Clostridia bacterium]|nr:GNAT family N-acetyltransferase [Clostridia bacterium]
MRLYRYENTVCDIDVSIFQQDEHCFFVLTRILQGECALTITDKKRLVICYSCSPYPVWIWLPDDATEEEKACVYKEVKENFGFDGTYRFNVKYSFAEYMKERAENDGKTIEIVTNMLAYECVNPNSPRKKPNGVFSVATEADLERATSLIESFHQAVGIDQTEASEYRMRAAALISERRLFFWTGETGEIVSMCSYTVSGDKGSIGNVFTKTDKRRRGYAAKLVYEVTKIVLQKGKRAILYTDADYAASNTCYREIGYQCKGSLCTVG